ncbi:MAG TPA: patatin, partial [Flavobacteriaceae bacterium]|nr:patatin [Flavobacteriaceae bacterium]
IGDYFDLIAGSSTGGLLASILLYPNDQKTANYSIKTAFDLYTEKGSDIFNVSFWQKLINPFGLFSEKISEEQLEKH